MATGSLGTRLKAERERRGMSQREFAHGIGVSQPFLSEVERDLCLPGGEMLISIKRRFGISLDWLVDGEHLVLTEGAPVPGPAHEAGELSDVVAGSVETDDRIRELEQENAHLRGQVKAYENILGRLRPDA